MRAADSLALNLMEVEKITPKRTKRIDIARPAQISNQFKTTNTHRLKSMRNSHHSSDSVTANNRNGLMAKEIVA